MRTRMHLNNRLFSYCLTFSHIVHSSLKLTRCTVLLTKNKSNVAVWRFRVSSALELVSFTVQVRFVIGLGRVSRSIRFVVRISVRLKTYTATLVNFGIFNSLD